MPSGGVLVYHRTMSETDLSPTLSHLDENGQGRMVDQHLAAAQLLAEDHPEIAEMLRTYGAGRADEAVAHMQRHRG